MIDFRDFLIKADDAVKKHSLGNGSFSRLVTDNTDDDSYICGCTDAVNIMYILNKLPKSYSARSKYIKIIQALQNPDTGLFHNNSDDDYYFTAYCAAALELLNARTLYPIKEMEVLADTKPFMDFVKEQPWSREPQTAAYRTSAVHASLSSCESETFAFKKTYFNWLWEHTDGDTGLIRRGFIDYRRIQPFLYLAGMFYYVLTLEFEHMPIRYPARTIDTCIQLYDRGLSTGFENDALTEALSWIYCTSRAMRQTDYRFRDCKSRMVKFEKTYTEYVLSLSFESNMELGNLHNLCIALCTIAEFQSALPGTIMTEKPLNNILDKQPFI